MALIRAEQRYIKQATAQFNASAEPSSPAAEPAADAETPVASAPLTTNADPAAGAGAEAPEAAPAATDAGPSFAPPAAHAAAHHDWLDYLTLLLSLTSVLLLLYLLTSVLPAFRRRLNELPGLPDEEQAPGLRARFRRETSSALEEDNYDDEPN